MSLSWFFPVIAPHRVQGRGLAEDNFAAEERKNEEIMGREGYQNALDARRSEEMVTVVMRVLNSDEMDTAYLRELITPEYTARLQVATDTSMTFDFSHAKAL